MNSNSINTPLRPVSLQNLNLGKFWTSTAISGWVDSIYSQSEVYIKHERDLREEELKQQQTGPGSSHEPIDIDSMDLNNNNNNSNNSNNNNNNNTNNNSNTSMNNNMNNMNINSNNSSNNTSNNMSTTVNTSGSYHQSNLYTNRS